MEEEMEDAVVALSVLLYVLGALGLFLTEVAVL